MTRTLFTLPLLAILACSISASAAPAPATEDPAKTGPLAATWKFSNDDGKTYSLDSLPELPSGQKVAVTGRCEFTVADPAKLGMVWFTTQRPEGGVCPVDDRQIGPRYVGNSPVLLNARLTLNGRPVELEMNDMLFKRVGLDPRLLRPGANVLTFRGQAWNALSNCKIGDSVAVAFRLLSSPSDALKLRAGPVLGPIGEDYFTLACRTHIPCEIRVTVKPVEPDGPEAVHAFGRETIHRVRMPVPKGTRKFRYSVAAVNGPQSQSSGPFEVRVPDASKGLRFVVLGQTASGSGTAGLVRAAESLRKTDPDFIIHTGSIVLMAYWDFAWDECLFEPWKDLLARVPMCVVPAYKDCYSLAFARLLYHPTPDGDWRTWTWAIGNVRFLGMDGFGAAHNPAAEARWIEETLKSAKEDYVFSVTAYPGYTSSPFGRGMKGHDFDKTVVHPLLAKYQATAELGCNGLYEYVEAPAGKGVPTVVTGGVGAAMAPGWWDRYHYCVFTVRDGKCAMEAIVYEKGETLDKRTFAPRKAQQ